MIFKNTYLHGLHFLDCLIGPHRITFAGAILFFGEGTCAAHDDRGPTRRPASHSGDGFSIGTTAEEIASLWLIGPELSMNKIMEWPLGKAGLSGFGTIRLARGRDVRGRGENADRLYFSPLRVAASEPAIYRLSRHAAFAAAGQEQQSRRHLMSRDDP